MNTSDGACQVTIEFDGLDALQRWNAGHAWQEWLEAASRLTGGSLQLYS